MRRLVLPVLLVAVASTYVTTIEAWDTALGRSALTTDTPFEVVAAIVALWFGVTWLAKRLLDLGIYSANRLRGLSTETPKLLSDIGGVVLFSAVAIAMVGIVFDQPIGGLLATSGLIAAIVGFAVRNTIADVVSGIALNIEQPFRIGDWLQFDEGTPEETGRVVELNWRATRMVTIQGRTIVVPNSTLASRRFVNLNTPKRHFRTVKHICVDFSVPPEQVLEIAMSAILATNGIVRSEKPIVLIDECNERGVVYSIHFWVEDYPQMFAVERQVVVNVLNFLNQAGLSPAYFKHELDHTWRHSHEIEPSASYRTLLERVPLFQLLDTTDLVQLAASAERMHYDAGSVVVKEGQLGQSLFVVVSGLLSATVDENGGAKEIGRVLPGEVFGEMSLLTGATRAASVVAISPSILLKIGKDHLEPLLKDKPALVDKLCEVQAERLSRRQLALAASQTDKEQIERLGVTAFLRRKVRAFFALNEERPES